MPVIPFVKRKLGTTYLIWFKSSNLYYQLAEPAWFVFSKIVKRYKTETIAKQFAYRYGLSLEEGLSFVSDIRLKVEEMNQVSILKNNIVQQLTDLNKFTFAPQSIHNYTLGEKTIKFVFDSQQLENYIHLLIDHLETSEDHIEMPLFELFFFNEKIVFRINNEVKGIWVNDESHLVKGKIFMELTNLMHSKTDEDWLMTVHASAITNGKKTILFSAAPGSGKTTIAALLQAQGYQLISDDFVPIDRHSFNCYPLPIAMSVKEGSMQLLASLYPALNQKPLNYISPEKSVRYLPAENQLMNLVYPVHEFIFIQYNKSVDFVWEKLDPVKAIRLLLDQTWVIPTDGNPDLLFDFVSQKSFYELSYSNNQKALEAIINLMEHDQ